MIRLGRSRWGMAPAISLVVVLIILLGAALRFDNITSSPGWFRDEGTYMQVAWNAIEGDATIGPVKHTWLSPWQTQPPIAMLTSGAMMQVIGELRGDVRPNIQIFRWHSAMCGVAMIALVMLLGHLMGSPLAGLLGGAILAIDPWSVMFQRMGLPYNLLAVEMLGTAALFAWYLKQPCANRLIWVICAASLAPVTVYYGIAVPLALGLAIAFHGRKRDLLLWPLGFLPLMGFLLGVWMGKPPGLGDDFAAMRAAAATCFRLEDWARDLIDLFATTPLVPLGLVGLALLPRHGVSLLLQGSGFLFALLWLKREQNLLWMHDANLNIHTPAINYQLATLLPLLALGAGELLLLLWRHLRGDARDGQAPANQTRALIGSGIFFVALAVALGTMLMVTIRGVQSTPEVGVPDAQARVGFTSPLSTTLGFQKRDVEGVAEFLWEQDVDRWDLIVAEYPLWWMLPGRHATLTQCLAYEGFATDFYPADMPSNRFTLTCNWREARWIVMGSMTSRWRAMGDLAVGSAVYEIQTQWPLVYVEGDLAVYESPLTSMPLSMEALTAEPVSP